MTTARRCSTSAPASALRLTRRALRRLCGWRLITEGAMAEKSEWPADRIERRAVVSPVPFARNSRTRTPAQIDRIAASIKEWGWTTPILVDEAGGIIAGHARLL